MRKNRKNKRSRQKQVSLIVVTGGPCGGKTTIMKHLKKKLTRAGFVVLVVSEAATEFINAGLRPGETISYEDFQEHIINYIIEKENRFRKAAKDMFANKIVILCDRGTMDSRAYISERMFRTIIKRLRTSIPHIRDIRYDAVVHLVTAAIGAPSAYTTRNNKARRETAEEAEKLDHRTLHAWLGHPHIKRIDNARTFREKKKRAFQHILHVLGVPVPQEIERKFIGKLKDLPKVFPVPFEEVTIAQTYLLPNRKNIGQERVRRRSQHGGTVYFYTIKKDTTDQRVRTEIERVISRKQYIKLLERKDPASRTILKKRRMFFWKGQHFELDIFLRPKFGFFLLEIELGSKEEQVEIPDFLTVTEVTQKKGYSNYALSRVKPHQ